MAFLNLITTTTITIITITIITITIITITIITITASAITTTLNLAFMAIIKIFKKVIVKQIIDIEMLALAFFIKALSVIAIIIK